ncbi:PRKR-interacting protein 1 homolog [Parasteatoda tepidariorum]|uniref:PRKR-interacting protein 1 homolog n=1 Tax=Parasteatoda tepidariorum TaxID=114398 RepID=UPI001C7203A0|nr:PRKR-interacting protein 1 homolog [Parasteatoda tepidariorum]XP_015921857.2 PRKR-interacting protein 1 homolog [Parasteatoda tepidariorum]XP_042902370.1 PRKR-interacting protein 1 homolog [Parasteatoda tepidariorum]
MSENSRPFVPKTPIDFQKLKLDRLMANPDKPVIIPDGPRERKGFSVPEFVRNVMGSSAGAGSGEFHVYRHLRRKEYTRQKMIEGKAEKEKLDEEFQRKIEENKRKMEEKTSKNRAKRLKRKERKKLKKGTKNLQSEKKETSSDSESEESSNEQDLEQDENSLVNPKSDEVSDTKDSS